MTDELRRPWPGMLASLTSFSAWEAPSGLVLVPVFPVCLRAGGAGRPIFQTLSTSNTIRQALQRQVLYVVDAAQYTSTRSLLRAACFGGALDWGRRSRAPHPVQIQRGSLRHPQLSPGPQHRGVHDLRPETITARRPAFLARSALALFVRGDLLLSEARRWFKYTPQLRQAASIKRGGLHSWALPDKPPRKPCDTRRRCGNSVLRTAAHLVVERRAASKWVNGGAGASDCVAFSPSPRDEGQVPPGHVSKCMQRCLVHGIHPTRSWRMLYVPLGRGASSELGRRT
ncbi:hypothetical protein PHYPSEUDO_015135 [Phytophthora pseudosyringae]|uniref:Uncharacterized protein n=1 Tax=Phytophthora pseudosyringae TaxID=221518 RepID=A0A8T1V670_9STRA|nr:hypothetical protein PHYPSEUDO_015135 [Phytophthora pseudosyringae]